jgi:hypothetical protein
MSHEPQIARSGFASRSVAMWEDREPARVSIPHRVVTGVDVRLLRLLHLRIDAQELPRLRVVVAIDSDGP